MITALLVLLSLAAGYSFGRLHAVAIEYHRYRREFK